MGHRPGQMYLMMMMILESVPENGQGVLLGVHVRVEMMTFAYLVGVEEVVLAYHFCGGPLHFSEKNLEI